MSVKVIGQFWQLFISQEKGVSQLHRQNDKIVTNNKCLTEATRCFNEELQYGTFLVYDHIRSYGHHVSRPYDHIRSHIFSSCKLMQSWKDFWQQWRWDGSKPWAKQVMRFEAEYGWLCEGGSNIKMREDEMREDEQMEPVSRLGDWIKPKKWLKSCLTMFYLDH